MNRCVIFGGGEIADLRYAQNLLREDDYIICADRGYAYCVSMGVVPDLVLGDFDSYNGSLPQNCELLRYPVEKDDTDTMLAVKEAIRRGYHEIMMLGMLGGRLDRKGTAASVAVSVVMMFAAMMVSYGWALYDIYAAEGFSFLDCVMAAPTAVLHFPDVGATFAVECAVGLLFIGLGGFSAICASYRRHNPVFAFRKLL